MKILRLVAWFAGSLPAFASLNSASLVLPGDNGRPTPAVSIVQPADYVCAVVTLRTTAKDPERQSAAIRESMQRLTDAISKSSRFQLHQGPLRLIGAGSGSYSSLAGPGSPTLQTTLRVLNPLQGTTDVFEATRQLRRFIASLPPTADIDLNVTAVSLAVATPDQYREQLLALISAQARTVHQNFGARLVIIDGLQNSVTVRQVDDLNVEIFVEYQLSANLEAR